PAITPWRIAGSAWRAPETRAAVQPPMAEAKNAPSTLNTIVAGPTSAHLRMRASTALWAPTATAMKLKSTAAMRPAKAPARTALQLMCQPTQLLSHVGGVPAVEV